MIRNTKLTRFFFAACFIVIAGLFAGSARVFGQVSLAQPNTASTENFNGIGTGGQVAVPNGWKIDNVGSSASPTNPNGASPTYSNSGTTTTQTGTGSGTAGGAYNFVDGSNTADHAIGFVASGSLASPRNMFVQLRNDTGQTITSLDVSFNYEKYRTAGRGVNMSFFASTDGINWSPTRIEAGSQDYAADPANPSGAIVGPPPAQTAKSFNLPNVNIPAGQSFYLRWEYRENGGSGSRQGIGIDDFSVTPRTANGPVSPTVTTSVSSLPDFGSVAVGAVSQEKFFTVSGSNLTDNIVVTAPADFLISTTSGDSYTQSITLPQTGGTVPNTSIYVIFAPTSGPGAKSGAITNASSGATTLNVSVSGTATQAFTVSGQVIYKGSQPLAGVSVYALQNGTVAGSAMTAANGSYAINLPAGGTYAISVATAPFTFAAPVQTVANLSGNQTVSFSATAASVYISEFRFHGTNSADEFVELYNNSDTVVDISGFALVSSGNATPKYVVPGDPGSRTVTIPARGHFLIVGAGYSLSAYAAPDGAMNAEILDGEGVGLFLNAGNIAPNGRIDAVGFNGANGLFTEGTPLNPPGGISADGETSFVRNVGTTGFSADTDNNGADFSFVSTTPGIYNGLQAILGAPGPENRQSPIFVPANVTGGIFDGGAAVTATPNRVTNPGATNNGLTPGGTLSTRTTYTNRAALAITRFRLRVIRVSTVGSPVVTNPQAIVRALSSADVTVTKTDGSVVPVKGTTIEAPPNQPQAGGLNTSLVVNLSAPINPGDSINVDLTIGIVQSGRLTLNTVVEANLAAPPSTSEHLALGNPSNATANPATLNNYLLDKPQYAVGYNCSRSIPNWVSWHLDQKWIGTVARTNNFRADPAVPAGCYQVQDTDYSGSGFDRGHHTPSADRTNTVPDNSATFLMSNMMPQAPDNNQGPWEQLESYCRSLLGPGNSVNELYIVAGGYGNGGTGSNGGVTNSLQGGKIAVPNVTFKVIVVLPVGDNDAARVNENTRVIAVIMPNTNGIKANDWRQYRVSVNQVEQLTGLTFFSNVSPQVQAVLKSRVDNQ